MCFGSMLFTKRFLSIYEENREVAFSFDKQKNKKKNKCKNKNMMIAHGGLRRTELRLM